jgi:hypothetical protein
MNGIHTDISADISLEQLNSAALSSGITTKSRRRSGSTIAYSFDVAAKADF